MRKEKVRKAGKREVSAGTLRVLGWSLAKGVVVSLLGLAICAWAIWAAVVSAKAGELCVLLSVAAGSLAGVWSIRRSGRRGVLWGLGVGVLPVLAFAVSGVLLYGGIDVRRSFTLGAVCAVTGAVAGSLKFRRGRKRR